MRDRRAGRTHRTWLIAAAILGCCLVRPAAGAAQTVGYRPKNGVLNWRAVVFGGGFRVTAAIPLHGDFARYSDVEVVQPTSLIGPDVPHRVLERLGRGLVSEFRKGGRFSHVALVETLDVPAAGTAIPDADSFRRADPLDDPMRPAADLPRIDAARRLAAAREAATDRTLVVRCQVIDYAKGNKWLQFLFLDLGNSVLTLRFSYFDRDTGEELGRSVISSDDSSAVVPSAFSPRSALTGVVQGLVDTVTRRKLAGER